MLKKITLAAALVLSVAGSAYAQRDNGSESLFDRQNSGACERPAAPNICK
jgi:hypothetical protein